MKEMMERVLRASRENGKKEKGRGGLGHQRETCRRKRIPRIRWTKEVKKYKMK